MPTEFVQIPLVLRAEEVAKILGISKSATYGLFRRKVVPRDALIRWIDKQVASESIA